MRTIRVELLREGPPHNQLLSPLTRYLAVVGNQAPEPFNIRLEHADFARWLLDLDVERQPDRPPSSDGLSAATQEVTRLFGSLESLRAEVAMVDGNDGIELELVLSASELASLPLELAEAPRGFPGEGQSLFRQARPVALTRHSHRIRPSLSSWPDRLRILVVGGSEALGDLPLEAHVAAIRKALSPWMGGEEAGSPDLEAATLVEVISNASWTDVSEACQKQAAFGGEPFTHVHFVAHGAPLSGRPSEAARHGIALRDERVAGGETARVVSGHELEVALRGGVEHPVPGPVVVTLATCQGGSAGTVVAPAGSLSHSLHEDGIPVVVASQFPMSIPGSALFAEILYEGFARNEDPRHTIHRARRELSAQAPGTHDWASIVCYPSLPADLDSALGRSELERTRKASDVAVKMAERALLAAAPEPGVSLEGALRALDGWVDRAHTSGNATGGTLGTRLRSSLAMRWADVLGVAVAKGRAVPVRLPAQGRRNVRFTELPERELVRMARDGYAELFDEERVTHGLVQTLGLSLALLFGRFAGERRDDPKLVPPWEGDTLDDAAGLGPKGWASAWSSARFLASRDPVSGDEGAQTYGCLAELALIGMMAGTAAAEAEAECWSHLRTLIRLAGRSSFRAFSAHRQLGRHARWLDASPNPPAAAVSAAAKRLQAKLAAMQVPTDWLER